MPQVCGVSLGQVTRDAGSNVRPTSAGRAALLQGKKARQTRRPRRWWPPRRRSQVGPAWGSAQAEQRLLERRRLDEARSAREQRDEGEAMAAEEQGAKQLLPEGGVGALAAVADPRSGPAPEDDDAALHEFSLLAEHEKALQREVEAGVAQREDKLDAMLAARGALAAEAAPATAVVVWSGQPRTPDFGPVGHHQQAAQQPMPPHPARRAGTRVHLEAQASTAEVRDLRPSASSDRPRLGLDMHTV